MSIVKDVKNRLVVLEQERDPYMGTWRECSDFIRSNRGRFLCKDQTGHKRNTKTLNNTPALAERTFSAGLVAGMTNPARPWFRLQVPDPDMMDYAPVREWLHAVELRMRYVFAKSNLYKELNPLYGEIGTFGTGSLGLFKDFRTVLRARQHTIGSYFLATDSNGRVDTHYREYTMTARQIKQEFGEERCGEKVRKACSDRKFEQKFTVIHAVEPNQDRRHGSPLSKDMKYRSVYVLKDSSDNDEPLRESGFKTFPYLTPRSDVLEGDVYASSWPGFLAIGDSKNLQVSERKSNKIVDLQADPPLQVPVSLARSFSGGIVPGDHQFVENTTDGIRTMFEVNANLRDLNDSITRKEERINKAFYADLFLMLAQSNHRDITATEVAERHEEKLLMLSPLVESFNTELYDPLIDLAFDYCSEAGIFPPPPEELQGLDLKVEYISTLNQAMKMVGVSAIESTLGFAVQAAQIDPNITKKINLNKALVDVADAYGAAPDIIRSDKEVAEIYQAEQAQIQRQQIMEAMQQAPDAVKKLADAETPEGNVLDRATGNG